MALDNDVYDVDERDAEPVETRGPEPLFRIYEGSRVAVGKGVGKMWQQRYEAALKAYDETYKLWTAIFEYYNFHHRKTITTSRGVFKEGDCSENITFSNLNIVLPAVYGKDPDVTCNTSDEQDQDFCRALEALLNALFKRKTALNAKPKIKKSVGFGLLTNFSVLRLDYTGKDDSLEFASEQMAQMTEKLEECRDAKEAERLYGQFEALEMSMEVREPSGVSLGGVLPQNLLVDPHAELPDGTDGKWMIEKIWLSTAMLTAKYTKRAEDEEGKPEGDRVLVYKPTHKAEFIDPDNPLDVVMKAIDSDVQTHTTDERTAYLQAYYTECRLVWDKTTRRVLLFHRDDWKWPIWVWDDYMKLSRFFPYFITSFAFSTGGTVSPGENAYVLDQQDEINDINRQIARIRRTVFDFFVYDSDSVDSPAEVEKLVEAIRGVTPAQKHVIGMRAGGKDVKTVLQAVVPPSLEYEALFNKSGIMDSVNRIMNISDAIRGVQFKTNTNVAAVNTYQDSMRLSIGAKVDVVEDVVADIATATAELCVQHYDNETVEGLIGERLAAGWKQMSVNQFLASYSLELVAGSMEKPNSVFKKKEAVEVSQAIGQFAQAAPGATLRIMLRVLEQAFTEVVIKPEDWDALDQEIQATLQKGVSTGAEPGAGGEGGGDDEETRTLLAEAAKLPEQAKRRVEQMKASGVPNEEIAQFILQQAEQQAGSQRQQSRGARR